jgi:hypothetical protein
MIQALLECFTLCDSQLRAGMAGAYTMDWSVVMRAAAAMEIEIDERLLRMFKALEGMVVDEMGKKNS